LDKIHFGTLPIRLPIINIIGESYFVKCLIELDYFDTLQPVKKIIKVLIAIVILALIISGIYLLIKVFRPKAAGIYIDSVPVSNVFIDGTQVGRTPYRNSRLTPGEILVRLVPDSFDVPLAPYDTKLTLLEKVETVIKRDFGPDISSSGLEQITFRKLDSDAVGLDVSGNIQGTRLKLDGQINAVVPYNTESITPGEHQITVDLEGYQSKNIRFKTFRGYSILIYVELKPINKIETTVTPTEELVNTGKEIYIEVLDTPNGFLRVRESSSTEAEEISRVKVGETFKLLEESEDKEWFNIEYQEGKDGWVSSQYVKKVDITPTISISPNPSSSTSITNTPIPKDDLTAIPTKSVNPINNQ
jgi:hypothetical protein